MWNLAGSPFDLMDHVAIFTGGGRSLGAVMAIGLAQAGANVAVIGRHIDEPDRRVDLHIGSRQEYVGLFV